MAATLLFLIQLNMIDVFAQSLQPYRPGQPQTFIIVAVVVICAAVVAGTMLVPWFLVVRLARWLGTRSFLYYLLAGTIVGWMLGTVLLASFPVDRGANPSRLAADGFFMRLLGLGVVFAPSGAIFGITYWLISGRRHGVSYAW